MSNLQAAAYAKHAPVFQPPAPRRQVQFASPQPTPGRDRDYTPSSQTSTEPPGSILDDMSPARTRQGYTGSPARQSPVPPPQGLYHKSPGRAPPQYQTPPRQPQPQQPAASPKVDVRQHRAQGIIAALVQASGEGWNERNTRHTQTGLDGLLHLQQGVYMTRFTQAGPEENWFVLGHGIGQYGYADYTPSGAPSTLVVATSAEEEEMVGAMRFPLTALRGVQRGASSKGFQRHYAGPGRIAGVAMNKQRAIYPPSLCFTLWFDTGSGFQPVDLAAVNEAFYERLVMAFEAIRQTNCASNYIHEVAPPRDFPAAQSPGNAGWERKDDTGCSVQ